eukprot:Opistho-1_new@3462
MKVFAVVLLAAALVASASAATRYALDKDIINEVNTANAGWKAGLNGRFVGVTMAEAKQLLGLRMDKEHKKRLPVITDVADAIPASFDARTQWPGAIHPIRDQQQCGSCWAFAASEALSDRFYIASKGSVDVVLSPQDMVSCDSTDYGCSGGYLTNAWQFLQNTGIVADSCYPYSSGGGSTGSCLLKGSTCPSGNGTVKYYKAKNAGSVAPNVAALQTELMTNGPIEVGFSVYEDFFSYTSGVYKHTSGGLAGGHAVKLIGWGTDNGTDYWLIANSWSSSWGENGYFRIVRGTDECGIEDDGVAGLPAL